jgi:hypothetical protein
LELNTAIREIVADLNARVMRKLGVSRLELLETIERPALKGLPNEPYQYAEWKKCRVAPDYHVEVERHYYSVPSRLIREQVEARITDTTIEIFHNGSRVASHVRSCVDLHWLIEDELPAPITSLCIFARNDLSDGRVELLVGLDLTDERQQRFRRAFVAELLQQVAESPHR